MGIWDSIVDYASNNWGDIAEAGVRIGGGIYQASQARDQSRAKEDLLRQQAQADYENQRAAQQAAMSGGGGGGFNTSAYMSALQAQHAQQAAYVQEAINFQKQKYADAQKFLKPYREEGYKLLPKVSGAYQNGLGLSQMLAAAMSQPEQMSKLSDNTSAYQVQIPLPEHLKYGR